jgi:hypothetical protein
MESLIVLALLALCLPFAVGALLPRFSAYCLGPVVLILTLMMAAVLHRYFVPFHSDGSPAGMLVPAMMWIVFVAGCIVGAVLILTGWARIRSKRLAEIAPDAPPQAGKS